MLQRAGILIVAALLGTASAVGAAGCGDQKGRVTFEGDTGGTATSGTSTTPTTERTTTERTATEP